MPRPDHIAVLEQRQKVLEDEVRKAVLHYATDDPMILDLKTYKKISERYGES